MKYSYARTNTYSRHDIMKSDMEVVFRIVHNEQMKLEINNFIALSVITSTLHNGKPGSVFEEPSRDLNIPLKITGPMSFN